MTVLSLFSMKNLIDEAVAGSYTWSEKLEIILTTALGGFALVFVVLALIWGVLEVFNKIFSKKNPTDSPAEEASPVTPSAVAEAPAETASGDEEIVAAIIAAISSYTNKPVSGFRVVSFRKKHK